MRVGVNGAGCGLSESEQCWSGDCVQNLQQWYVSVSMMGMCSTYKYKYNFTTTLSCTVYVRLTTGNGRQKQKLVQRCTSIV